MGLFEKKYCDICGAKIGLMGKRKLEDGKICKECANKLSPWFDERRHSTVDEIKEQLDYRERNRAVLAQFVPDKVFECGSYKVYVDEKKGQFAAARDIGDGDNHDVIELDKVTGCDMDVIEHRSEERRTNSEGERVSYDPPRYKYTYDYYVCIYVNCPYFDEIKLPMNTLAVSSDNRMKRRKIQESGNRIASFFNGVASGRMRPANEDPVVRRDAPVQPGGAGAAQGEWVCAGCGSRNSGKFCENCGSPRP